MEYTAFTKSDQDDDVALKCQTVSFHISENSTTNQQMKMKKEKHQPDWTVNASMAPQVY
jgi:uncharacterized protein involved in outer membrane biogenesis